MEKLIQTIVIPLVSHPEDIKITKEEHASSITYHLSVNQDDKGKVIGKQGRIAKAMRIVTSGAELASVKKVFVEID
ncbi:hypothetical protein CW662_03080 [Macrococcoides caseolyticum]|uniref:KH domain-containing protein n=1 Tax=Macrococcoides caseolyticum TaxID=69966 RepID=UPI000C33EFBE|nr:KH domain-containing protein [Macrococcus caseolyticus]PKE70605.1 hypothetical protein CW662_03080 [Macrococcus caseolyticus]